MLPPNQSTPKTTQNPFSSSESRPEGSTHVLPNKMQQQQQEEKKNTTCTTVTVATGIESSCCSSGRERLKRHRVEVAGRVWIPDMWGQEAFLKDWIDCGAFDASLVNSSIMSARAALVEQGRTLSSTTPTVVNY
ncbi:UNVERIFIED_CONTAM: protein BIC1 [Sesamum latifolium]|uniref:Protein BIC1 n=1 Tax=Sesamum latifolium TaxID=2727402 RepID=A0AAW2TZX5_9LAMI